MHLRGGITLPVVANLSFSIRAGECTVLGGPSGAGKSSILKMVYGNYAVDRGQIIVAHDGRLVDIATASPRAVLAVRRATDRLCQPVPAHRAARPALDIVAEPLFALRHRPCRGAPREPRELLARLNLPERLWQLPPATFSGGEQQRVNIARGFITDHPILLLDEPTASLDAQNRDVVIGLIAEKKAAGVAFLGIFHDDDVRDGGRRPHHRRHRLRARKAA